MGDRAIVLVVEKDAQGKVTEASPTIYLHWNGTEALDWLQAAIPTMRMGDVPYSAARLVGYCCNQIDGNLGIGIWQPPSLAQMNDAEELGALSEGDAGVIVYDCRTGEASLYAGYLEQKHGDSVQLKIPPL